MRENERELGEKRVWGGLVGILKRREKLGKEGIGKNEGGRRWSKRAKTIINAKKRRRRAKKKFSEGTNDDDDDDACLYG